MVFVDGDAQEGTRHGHIILGEVFLEVFEATQGGTAFLDLVDDDESVGWNDVNARVSGKGTDDATDIVVRLEDGFGHGILVEVDISDTFVLVGSELFEDVGFAHLSGTIKYQGLMVSTRLPFKEFCVYFSFHDTKILTNRIVKTTKILTNQRGKYTIILTNGKTVTKKTALPHHNNALFSSDFNPRTISNLEIHKLVKHNVVN